MRVNQDEVEIEETIFYPWGSAPTHEELWQIVAILLDNQKLEAVRTNATKSCNFEIELRSTDP